MINRLTRIGIAALLTTALAGTGAAWAQDEEEEESSEDDDSDPCADVKNPCGGEDSSLAREEDDGDDEEVASDGGDRDEGDGDDGGGSRVASGDDDMGTDAGVATGATLPAGKLSISAWLQVSLATDSAGDPLSIAPDVWYGINQKLSAGVVTSTQGASGFWSGLLGTGICVAGDLCDKAFDNIGAEALYGLKADESLGFAVNAGFHALAFDPITLDVKLGAKGAFRSGKLSIGFAPNVFIAVTERGDPPDGGGNYDLLNLPVDFNYMVSQKLHVGVQSGVNTNLQNLGDAYRVPVALGGTFLINPKMTFSGAFTLDAVVDGVDGGSATDARSLSVMFGYMM